MPIRLGLMRIQAVENSRVLDSDWDSGRFTISINPKRSNDAGRFEHEFAGTEGAPTCPAVVTVATT